MQNCCRPKNNKDDYNDDSQAEENDNTDLENGKYCEPDDEGEMKCREMTPYEKQLEKEVEKLQNALFTLSSHYAKIQFRLRQITNATDCERQRLLRELERVSSESLDGKPHAQDELPSLVCDAHSMGNVRAKQRKIITQLRSRLQDLKECTKKCFDTDEGGCYSRRVGSRCGAETCELNEPKHGTGCMCCNCHGNGDERCVDCEDDFEKRYNAKQHKRRTAEGSGYYAQTWNCVCSETESETESDVTSQKKAKKHRVKHKKNNGANGAKSRSSSIASSKRLSRSSGRNLNKNGHETTTSNSRKRSSKRDTCRCVNRLGYPVPYTEQRLAEMRNAYVTNLKEAKVKETKNKRSSNKKQKDANYEHFDEAIYECRENCPSRSAAPAARRESKASTATTATSDKKDNEKQNNKNNKRTKHSDAETVQSNCSQNTTRTPNYKNPLGINESPNYADNISEKAAKKERANKKDTKPSSPPPEARVSEQRGRKRRESIKTDSDRGTGGSSDVHDNGSLSSVLSRTATEYSITNSEPIAERQCKNLRHCKRRALHSTRSIHSCASRKFTEMPTTSKCAVRQTEICNTSLGLEYLKEKADRLFQLAKMFPNTCNNAANCARKEINMLAVINPKHRSGDHHPHPHHQQHQQLQPNENNLNKSSTKCFISKRNLTTKRSFSSKRSLISKKSLTSKSNISRNQISRSPSSSYDPSIAQSFIRRRKKHDY